MTMMRLFMDEDGEFALKDVGILTGRLLPGDEISFISTNEVVADRDLAMIPLAAHLAQHEEK